MRTYGVLRTYSIKMLKTLVFVCAIASVFAVPANRIVGGTNAEVGVFAYQISLRVNNQHICGGSIIGRSKILTAAHCVYGNNQPMTVVVGITRLSDIGGQRLDVAYNVIHPQYDSRTLVNDVAILHLSGTIQINNLVRTISLRTSSVPPGERTILTGWGLTSYPGNISNDLQYLELGVLSLDDCAQRLVGANPITTGHICTTSPQNEGACQGDSGGPLIDANGQQIGVVSWGVPCAKGLPDVFTSVPFYSSWIENN